MNTQSSVSAPISSARQSSEFKVQGSEFNVQSSTIAPSAPWSDSVDGKLLLDSLASALKRFVVLPKHAPETLALWVLHTYAFQLRDTTAYIGIESPEKRCGKTTLLTVLNELAHHALTAANISPPAFFRVIEDLAPTLLIDEADTFLNANDALKGILNAGYKKKTAFVYRASNESRIQSSEFGRDARLGLQGSKLSSEFSISNPPSSSGPIARFSCWCPKAIATIDRLPDTLADRCIIIRMHRKATNEECERIRSLDPEPFKRQCARFVLDHSHEIAVATPELPRDLSDRAAEIWEPLLALADLAGGDWPQRARQAALSLSASAQQSSPIGSLLLDMFLCFFLAKADRILSRDLIDSLNNFLDRPWMEIVRGKVITDRWLAQQLRPYGIKPRTLRIGEVQAKGYLKEDCIEVFRRYIPRSELEHLAAETSPPEPAAPAQAA